MEFNFGSSNVVIANIYLKLTNRLSRPIVKKFVESAGLRYRNSPEILRLKAFIRRSIGGNIHRHTKLMNDHPRYRAAFIEYQNSGDFGNLDFFIIPLYYSLTFI